MEVSSAGAEREARWFLLPCALPRELARRIRMSRTLCEYPPDVLFEYRSIVRLQVRLPRDVGRFVGLPMKVRYQSADGETKEARAHADTDGQAPSLDRAKRVGGRAGWAVG